MKKYLLLLAFLLSFMILGAQEVLDDGLYATFHFDDKSITFQLDMEGSPLNSAVFAGLAEGTVEAEENSSFYKDLLFYRTIEGYALFSGDPTNTGEGITSISYPQQNNSNLSLGDSGILAFQGYPGRTLAGPFFITLMGDAFLDQVYTPFAKIVQGEQLLNSIEQSTAIDSIEIIKIGNEAQNFDISQSAIDQLIDEAKEAQLNQLREEKPELAAVLEEIGEYQQSPSGIFYKILYEGVGIKPRTGNKVTVHYSGKLLNGQVFDSSIQRGTPYEMELGVDPVIEGWVETLMDMRPGEGRMVVIPPELAYGEKSAGNVIGPNSWLIFEIQLLNVE